MKIIVQRKNDEWQVSLGKETWPCSIGKNGTVPANKKIEGDGKTPVGKWEILKVLFRGDRVSLEERSMINKDLVIDPISQRDGWCDEPEDPYYNQAVIVPYASRYENLWQDQENSYDLIVILGYNMDPIIPGRGSAIFLHIAKPGMTPTEGCIAMDRNDLLKLLSLVNGRSLIDIVG